MKCPYCAEDIKDEALVCLHCRRDLTFFKPFEQRIHALERKVSSIATDISEISNFLSSLQTPEKQSEEAAFVGVVEKPTFLRLALVVLLHVLLTAVFLAIFSAIEVSIRPSFEYYNSGTIDDAYELKFRQLAFERQYESYIQRQKLITIFLLPTLFAIPIAIGLWIGIRWRGGHFKRYLILGLSSGAIEALLFSIFLFLVEEVLLEDSPYLLVILLINVARSTFGFITGGLVGDWIEKKRFPKRYAKGFAEQLASRYFERKTGVQAGDIVPGSGLEAKVKSLASAITAMAPILALVGTIVTSYLGYKATTKAAEAQVAAEQAKAASKATETKPSPMPNSSNEPSNKGR